PQSPPKRSSNLHLVRGRYPVLPFDMAHARDSARLRPLTRGQGISAGDRGCLAVARSLGTSVLTTDRAWARLDAAVGVTVELVR
ncbi:PIN domain-containing protein, partial [uncultured Methylobacterium sp.]|uniref:PIN domain-containing protein n=1 Tax=uncultured Methylobacterium sp. TaxID=157278 RepID=UPI00343B4463